MWLLLLAQAHAWQVIGVDWAYQDDPIEEPVHLNVGSFPSPIRSEVEGALVEALDVWNFDSGAAMEVRYEGRSDHRKWGGGDDGFNVVLFEEEGEDGVLAQAAFSSVAGNIVDCDIRFFGRNGYGEIDWNAGVEDPQSGEYDLATVAIHELGHCLGLDHSEEREALMYASVSNGVARRSLHEDDTLGVTAIYGDRAVHLVAAETWVADPGGDRDGTVEQGEPVEVWLILDNQGKDPAPEVVAVAETDSPYLEIVGGAVRIGDLAPGESADDVRFDLRVTDSCAVDESAVVLVTITDADKNTSRKTVNVPLRCSVQSGLVPEVMGSLGCTTGGPAGAWAVLLGLLALLPRRR